MFRNFFTVSGWTIISRILGLIRDQCLAAFVGAGMMQDTYQVAARLPNMFRRLFGEGAFNAAFVPIFSSLLVKKSREEVQEFAKTVLALLVIFLTCLCVIGEIFMPQLLHFLAPGFLRDPSEFRLSVTLCRITFPYLIFICAIALLSGVLNGLHDFAIAAASYLIFNVVGIACIVGGYLTHRTIVVIAAWGICVAGILQFALLLAACKRAHFSMFPLTSISVTPSVKELGKRMIPGLIGSGAGQINLMIDTVIGTFLPAGSISVMYFADRVNQLPLGVIGAACGTTLLPVLSHHLIKGEYDKATEAQNKTLLLGMMLSLPAACGLWALSMPILMTLFGHGAFHYQDAIASSQCLYVYCIGLPAFVLTKVITPSFFARGDTSTPVKIGLGVIVLNLLLNLLFMKPLSYMGPPLASSLCAIINVILLWMALRSHNAFVILKNTKSDLLKIAVACAVMMIFLITLQKLWVFPQGSLIQFFWLCLFVGMGGVVYFAMLFALRMRAMARVRQIIRR